jgi:hypothetical protein
MRLSIKNLGTIKPSFMNISEYHNRFQHFSGKNKFYNSEIPVGGKQ